MLSVLGGGIAYADSDGGWARIMAPSQAHPHAITWLYEAP